MPLPLSCYIATHTPASPQLGTRASQADQDKDCYVTLSKSWFIDRSSNFLDEMQDFNRSGIKK